MRSCEHVKTEAELKRDVAASTIAAVAFVVCYIIVRRFFWEHVNFPAWAFLLSVVAAMLVAKDAGEKREFLERERISLMWFLCVFPVVGYDLFLLSPESRFHVFGAVGAYFKVAWLAPVSLIAWLIVRNIEFKEDKPVVQYTAFAGLTVLSIGGFWIFVHSGSEYYSLLVYAIMFTMVAVSMPPQSLIDFIKSRKRERT